MSYNRNPEGHNQYSPVLKADDPILQEALRKYHHEKITNNELISERLLAEYGITMKPQLVKKRRTELGLLGSRSVMQKIDSKAAEQLVLNEVERDSGGHKGPRTIVHAIAKQEGIHLSRQFTSDIMHLHFPDGFPRRNPTSKKIRRSEKVPLGIHERWSGDGHDKLYGIGFPIWAVVDDATGKWLGAWVVPSNRLGHIVGYLFLSLVEDYGGMPLQFTTDCGSETMMVFGFVNALRDMFHPEYQFDELPAHVYIKSVHNIAIERSWLRLRLEFGDTAVIKFQEGLVENGGPYQPNNPIHYELCQWLWPKLLREKLANFVEERNAYKSRKDKNKAGPSGMSRNTAFSLPAKWGGKNFLLSIDVDLVREIKTAMGGDRLLDFVTPEYSAHIQAIYDALNISQLDFGNVWEIFSSLLSCLN